MVTMSDLPLVSLAGSIGKVATFVLTYSSVCMPSVSRCCLK